MSERSSHARLVMIAGAVVALAITALVVSLALSGDVSDGEVPVVAPAGPTEPAGHEVAGRSTYAEPLVPIPVAGGETSNPSLDEELVPEHDTPARGITPESGLAVTGSPEAAVAAPATTQSAAGAPASGLSDDVRWRDETRNMMPSPQIGPDGQDRADYSAVYAAAQLVNHPPVRVEILDDDLGLDLFTLPPNASEEEVEAHLTAMLADLSYEELEGEALEIIRSSLAPDLPLGVRLQALNLLHTADPGAVIPYLDDTDEFVALEAERLLANDAWPSDS